MADFLVNVGVKDNASQPLNDIKQGFDEVGQSTQELDKVRQRFEKITSSCAPAKKQLKDLQGILAGMNLKGLSNTDVFTEVAQKAGELKDAMADAGQAVKAYADDTFQLKAAGEMFKGIAAAGSVATGVMGMFGAENEKVKQILLKVQAAQAILNGVTAIANILNKDSALMLKIKQIRMAANTATTVKDTAATAANSASITVNTAATVANTAAQKAWNTAKAIGKAMFGDFTGLVLLGIGAIGAYAAATASSTDEIKKNTSALGDNKKALEVQKEAESSYASTTASNFATMMKAYDDLRDKWNKLKSAKEKNKFLTDNKTKIEELTTAIHDITSAESIFNDKTGSVVKAFKLRAQAAAAAAVQVEMYKKAMEAEMNMKFGMRGAELGQDAFNRLPKNLQDQLKVAKTERRVTGFHYQGSPSGPYKVNDYAEVPVRWVVPDNASKELLDELRKYGLVSSNANQQYHRAMELAEEADQQSEKLLAQANALLAEGKKGGSGSTHTGGNNTKKTINSIEEAIEAYKKFDNEIKKVQQNIDEGWITKEAGEKSIATFKAAQKKILDDWSSKGLKIPVATTLDENSLKAIEDNIKKLQDQRTKVNVDSSEFTDLTNKIRELEHKKVNIEAKINKEAIDKEIRDIVKGIRPTDDVSYDFNFLPENVAEEADKIVDQLDRVKDARQRLMDIINDSDASDYEINEATSALAGMEEEYKRLTREAANFNAVAAQIKERQREFENFTNAVQNTANVVGSINGVYSSVKSLKDAVDEGKSGWEQFMAAFEVGMSIMQAVTTIMGIVNTVQDAMTVSKAASTAALSKEAAAHSANATAANIESVSIGAAGTTALAAVAPTIALATAVKKLAAAQIFEAHAFIPFAGPPAAAAGVATMEATLMALTAFANGGIVTGSSRIGDHMIARVNAGEMILNGRQQKNLFNMLDKNNAINEPVIIGGDIKFRGSDLYLSLKNETNKKNRLS